MIDESSSMPDNQLTSLNISKHLKQLGITKTSLFYWVCLSDGTNIINHNLSRYNDIYGGLYVQENVFKGENHYSAFTVEEIIELIGKKLIQIYKNAGLYNIQIYGYEDCSDENLADALAKMLIQIK